MRAKLLISLILASYVLLFVEIANAQTNPIKVHFKVDGEEVQQPFRIEISLNGLVLKPKVENGSFIFPPELLSEEKVDLRFVSGKYDLDFKNIALKKFNEIDIGVDNKPFEDENLPSELPPDKELVFIYYISMGTGQLMTYVWK